MALRAAAPGSAVSFAHNDKLTSGFMKQKGLQILHQNVRGLLCNLPLLQKFLYTIKTQTFFAVLKRTSKMMRIFTISTKLRDMILCQETEQLEMEGELESMLKKE